MEKKGFWPIQTQHMLWHWSLVQQHNNFLWFKMCVDHRNKRVGTLLPCSQPPSLPGDRMMLIARIPFNPSHCIERHVTEAPMDCLHSVLCLTAKCTVAMNGNVHSVLYFYDVDRKVGWWKKVISESLSSLEIICDNIKINNNYYYYTFCSYFKSFFLERNWSLGSSQD